MEKTTSHGTPRGHEYVQMLSRVGIGAGRRRATPVHRSMRQCPEQLSFATVGCTLTIGSPYFSNEGKAWTARFLTVVFAGIVHDRPSAIPHSGNTRAQFLDRSQGAKEGRPHSSDHPPMPEMRLPRILRSKPNYYSHVVPQRESQAAARPPDPRAQSPELA